MRIEEAQALGRILAGMPAGSISPVLNIGSSTADFRENNQPHIDRYIFAPLRERGVQIIHADIKQAAGVDIAGDVLDPAFQARLREIRPGAVLCSNVLEHVADIGAFAAALEAAAVPGTHLIITVPQSYPYHLDPIDNGFRPSPEALAALFEGCEPVQAETVLSSTYGEDLKAMGPAALAKFILMSALRFPFFFHRHERWKSRYHRFLWLFRRYAVSVAVVRKAADEVE